MSSDRRISLRTVLLLLLGLAIAALCVDLRARNMSNEADDRLAEVNATDLPGPQEVQEIMKRKPTSTREVGSGLIEIYNYTRGIPGRPYSIRIGYANDAEQQMRYVDHNFNQPEGDVELEQVIAAQKYRSLHPLGEESVEELQGPAELGLDDTYRGVQRGARLVLAYDAAAGSFNGTIENTTRDTMKRAQVSVQLSNGMEAGPVTLGDLESGSQLRVELKMDSTDFDRWTAYAESDLYLNEKYEADRNGARIALEFDSETKMFSGTVSNATENNINKIGITVELSNGEQLGPTTLAEIPPGSELDVELKAESADFEGWSVRIKVE